MIPRWHRQSFPILAAIVLMLRLTAFGHTTGLSTSDLRFTSNGLSAEVILAGADITLALAHLEGVVRTDSDGDGKLTKEELATALTHVRKFAQDCLVVKFDGKSIRPDSPTLTLDDKDNFRIQLNYPGERPARLSLLTVLFDHLPSEHMHFLSVLDKDGTPLGKKMLRPGDNVLEIELVGTMGAERRISTFADFLKLGVEHIWTGYDHLMFLLALLLVCTNFKSAIQVVTFFTVAHSITLAFATLNLVSVSGRVVEPAIAASIVYVGVENLFLSEDPKGRWLITFLFGLIHGLGFATVLRDLGVSTSTTGVTIPLVAFNIGVEAGQIVIAAIMLPAIWKLKQWPPFQRWGVRCCSAVVAIAGGYWLIQRLRFG